MLGSTRGYKIKVVMPADVPPERIDILRAFGAEVIFSDPGKGNNESINLAKQISNENPNYFMPYQYGNEANPKAHYETTGPEIIKDLPDTDVFVAALGTAGTLRGLVNFLRNIIQILKLLLLLLILTKKSKV